MHPSRRDLLKAAAALDVARSAPEWVSPAEAAAQLAAPATASLPVLPPGTPTLFDPEEFATRINNWLNRVIGDHNFSIPQAELDAFEAACAAAERAFPVPADPATDPAWAEVTETAYAMAGEAYFAGLRVGAACEHLRRVLAGPKRLCPVCEGSGLTSAGERGCPRCSGAGTVSPASLPC